MKKTAKQKKVSKVMREFKKGELNIGKSSKKVKSKKTYQCLLRRSSLRSKQ